VPTPSRRRGPDALIATTDADSRVAPDWLAVQLELYGDPPMATQRPFEEFGPSPPPPEDEVPTDEPQVPERS